MERPDLYQYDDDRLHIRDQSDEQDVPDTAAKKPDIDVDRLIWDPDYRTWVKERMRRTA